MFISSPFGVHYCNFLGSAQGSLKMQSFSHKVPYLSLDFFLYVGFFKLVARVWEGVFNLSKLISEHILGSHAIKRIFCF